VIVLDTNVVSEPLRARADPAVAAWLDRQLADTLYLTAISLSELLLGIAVLPQGRRRTALQDGMGRLVDALFPGRVLPFDRDAARDYAGIVASARAAGRSIPVADAQIAAIASLHGFAIATRDTAPFLASGLRVVDPWKSETV